MLKNNYNIGYRPTWAEINLDHLAHNFFLIKKIVSQSVKVMACVKADGYGHGAIPCARKLVSCGVDWLGVASIDEAIKLRKAGINTPILVLGLVLVEDIDPLFEYNITPTVCDEVLIEALNKKAQQLNKVINVHIKVDTGMGRIGIRLNKSFDFICKAKEYKNIRIEGIFTHLACADIDVDFTNHQIKSFSDLVEKLKISGIYIDLVHAANSMGIVAYKESHFNLVRPGLILYGLTPKEDLKIDLKPVLNLKTEVIFVKEVESACGISYGHTFKTKKKTTIVTLPVGYGDGYPRNLSNLSSVLINGKSFNICGRICMDQMMVDVGNSDVKVGDDVILIGQQQKSKITAEELAELSGTISYEIVCGLGSRVPRIYIENNKIYAEDKIVHEMRFYPRVAVNLSVRFSDQESFNAYGYTKDISERGIGLISDRPLLKGRDLTLDFPLAEEEGGLSTRGKVMWSRQVSEKEFYSGISLGNINFVRLAKDLNLVQK